MTVRPSNSTMRVAGPASAPTSAAEPTAAMRPSFTASASAMESSASTVRISPPVRIRSGSGRHCAEEAVAEARERTAAAARRRDREGRFMGGVPVGVRAGVSGGYGVPAAAESAAAESAAR